MAINSNQKQIVDQAYLESKLHLSANFISRHSRAMGCFARNPRKFLLDKVMKHLEQLASDVMINNKKNDLRNGDRNRGWHRGIV